MTQTAEHSLLFKLWIKIRGLLAILIVLFGIFVGLVTLILPNEELYKPYVVSFLSKQLQKPVEIKSISGKWKGFGPKFVIHDLIVKDADEVSVQQATLSINIFKYLIPKGSTGIDLGISDIAVDFVKQESGTIVITDKERIQQSLSDKLEKLLSTGSLSIQNLALNIQDEKSQQSTLINTTIKVQQTQDQRAFVMRLNAKQLADKITLKAISDKSHDFMKQAKWYIDTKNLSLEKLKQIVHKDYIPKAFVDLEIWADTKDGNISTMIAKGELKNKLFAADAEITAMAELVHSGNSQDWNTRITLKDIITESISQEQINIHLSRHDNKIKLVADVLDVPLLKAITHVLKIADDSFYDLQVKGKLSNVNIVYDVELRRVIDADINFQQMDLTADFGLFTQLAGAISLHNDQIRLIIDSENGTAELPKIMRGKAQWNNLLLTAQTSMQDDDLDIKINSLWCDCNDFDIDGAARINYNEQLFLDLSFAVYNAKVNQLYKYWPAIVWKPKLLNFLDQALVDGVVKRGIILYHGLTKDYPFTDHQGTFITASQLENATVKYHKQWPLLKDFDAYVVTKNAGLKIKSTQGRTLNAVINDVNASIKNFKHPFLHLDVRANGQDNFLIDYLKHSPMINDLKILNEGITLQGKQKVKVNLDFSLAMAQPIVTPVGRINFLNTTFNLGQFHIKDLLGSMDFDGFSLNLNDIKARFLNKNVILSGNIVNQPQQDTAIDVVINGNYDVKNFESTLGFSVPANGSSAWQFHISNKDSAQTNFTAKSNLLGIALTIPQPFNKTASQQTPFSITCALPCIEGGWDLNYDNKISTQFSINAESNEIKLHKLIFGKSQNDFGGTIDTLDVDKWLTLFSTPSQSNNGVDLPFNEMSLQVNALIFMSRTLKNVSIAIDKNNQGVILHLKGDEINGKVTIAKDLDNKGITVQLDKLHWQTPDKQTIAETTSRISSSYPALHIWIGDFIYDDIPLGEATIEVRPITDGIRVEKLITESEYLNLNINGEWLRSQGENGLSKFNIIVTSKDIATFLTTLGFQAPISQADTVIDMQAQWHDFPSQFEIKNISGKMRIEVGKGEVIDAKPGLGRVLGLFSLTNLPRRLILDFSDVLGKGLQFTSMKGDFTLDNGDAYTESFIIDSSSAKITLSGKTGLANQDYDQYIVVEPRVGRILPTIGAIAGGAVGAAAGFLVQGMFHKGLKNVGKIIYKVTGNWENPSIELIETTK